MSGKNAIAAMTEVLRGVAVTGPNVYDQIRYTREPDDFNARFLDVTDPQNPVVHTWMVTREGTRGADQCMQAAKATHQIVATGFRAFQDNVSEPAWQDELDAIFAALIPYVGRHGQAVLTDDGGTVIFTDGGDSIASSGGAVEYFDWSGPPVIEGIKLAFFGTVLCHTARVIMPFEEFPL